MSGSPGVFTFLTIHFRTKDYYCARQRCQETNNVLFSTIYLKGPSYLVSAPRKEPAYRRGASTDGFRRGVRPGDRLRKHARCPQNR